VTGDEYEEVGHLPGLFVFSAKFQETAMSTPYADLLRTTSKTTRSRAEVTDSTVRSLLEEEAAARTAQLKSLREARLAMETKAIAKAKREARKAAPLRARK